MSLLNWLPVLCLVAIALHHRWRIHAIGQSAWKGGGFGMFSDVPRHHMLALMRTTDSSGIPIELRIDAKTYEAKVTVLPTGENALQWARQIAAGQWQRVGNLARPYTPGCGIPPLALERISVHHLELDFDGSIGRYQAAERHAYSLVLAAGKGPNDAGLQ